MGDFLSEELEAWNFFLPEKLVARHGLLDREKARLLLVKTKKPLRLGPPQTIQLSEYKISDLPDLLLASDLLVANNTRVSKRRIYLQRETGAKLEALFLSPLPSKSSSWLCLLRNQRKAKPGEKLYLYQAQKHPKKKAPVFCFEPLSASKNHPSLRQPANAVLTALHPETKSPAWKNRTEAENFFQHFGELPLPPYLQRQVTAKDEKRYQTVFSQNSNSVAAPTAGLHFSQELLQELKKKGIQLSYLDLQIGYGTFAPISKEQWQEKRLHQECFEIPKETAQKIRTHQGRLIAIGTTSLRALESSHQNLLAQSPEIAKTQIIKEGLQHTELFLRPPEHPKLIDGLLTNFHLPKSSLLLLIGSILGHKNTMLCYHYAIEKEFRFFSYGDAMLILP